MKQVFREVTERSNSGERVIVTALYAKNPGVLYVIIEKKEFEVRTTFDEIYAQCTREEMFYRIVAIAEKAKSALMQEY